MTYSNNSSWDVQPWRGASRRAVSALTTTSAFDAPVGLFEHEAQHVRRALVIEELLVEPGHRRIVHHGQADSPPADPTFAQRDADRLAQPGLVELQARLLVGDVDGDHWWTVGGRW